MESDESGNFRKAPKQKSSPKESDPDASKLIGTQKQVNPGQPKPRRTRKKATVAAGAVDLSPGKPSISRRSAQPPSPREPVALKDGVPKAPAPTSGKTALQKNHCVKKTAGLPGSEATGPSTDEVKILHRRGRTSGTPREASDITDGGARTRSTSRRPGSKSRSDRGEKRHRSSRHQSRSSGGGRRRPRSHRQSRAGSSARSISGKRTSKKRRHSRSKSSKRSSGRKRTGGRHHRSTSMSSASGAAKIYPKKIPRSRSPGSARRKHGASKY
ncbi:uncharacterized protein LOC144112459 [Amblyomma americanum]